MPERDGGEEREMEGEIGVRGDMLMASSTERSTCELIVRELRG